MTPQPGEALPLSEEELRTFRQIIDEALLSTEPDLMYVTMIRRLLATLDRERYVAQEMYRRESAVSSSLHAPGLPSSFPVGSVSGSPKLPHAYNVREEEEQEQRETLGVLKDAHPEWFDPAGSPHGAHAYNVEPLEEEG